MILHEHIVTELSEPARLSDYAVGVFSNYINSRKGIKKAIKKGFIQVNLTISETGYWISEGDVLTLHKLNEVPTITCEVDFEIVFEDEYLAIVNKPAGIDVSGNKRYTLRNGLGRLVKSALPDALDWPEPMHRLDNQTSGLLLIAKTRTAMEHLHGEFRDGKVGKVYHALVVGEPGEGIWSSEIGGKPSETKYTTLQSVDSTKFNRISLLRLSPITGRTHQLRIHCSENGFPILGDKLYGEEGNTLLHKGLFLAATELNFTHPNKQTFTQATPLPAKFVNRLKREESRASAQVD